MFLVQFQCSNKFGSVRSALHQRVIARTIQCNWSTLVQTWRAWMGYFRPFELWGARGTCSLLQLFPFLWLLFFQFWVHLPGIIFNVCRPARQSECWINYWMDTKTAACGRVTGSDYASVCTGTRVQAGKSGRAKRTCPWKWGMGIDQRQATYWKRIQCSGLILSDLQLWWVSSIREISIEAPDTLPSYFSSFCGFTVMTHFAFEQIGGRIKLLEKPEMFSCSTDSCLALGVCVVLSWCYQAFQAAYAALTMMLHYMGFSSDHASPFQEDILADRAARKIRIEEEMAQEQRRQARLALSTRLQKEKPGLAVSSFPKTFVSGCDSVRIRSRYHFIYTCLVCKGLKWWNWWNCGGSCWGISCELATCHGYYGVFLGAFGVCHDSWSKCGHLPKFYRHFTSMWRFTAVHKFMGGVLGVQVEAASLSPQKKLAS